ncbi:MAG: (d)CMP kinase [Rhabdochlamydiaceae bacterium]|jgi:cytidylate kinase
MIITIDGPSGTGKTTVARKVADKLHFIYFDTGAMYRAFTWLVLKQNVDVRDSPAIENLLREFIFKIVDENGKKQYFVGDHNVTEVIRSRPVTAHVSAVSALKEVRASLLNIQHRFAKTENVVFEGRDLGTVVFPNAELKIFLNADPQIRAERRLIELIEKQPQEAENLSREQMLADIMRRDEYDSTRDIAPLRCPPDAFQIDTTHFSVSEVVDQIVNYFEKIKK